MKNSPSRHPNIIHAEHNGAEFQFALIQALINAMPDGILVVDQQDIIVATNERLFELWNIDPDSFEGVESSTLVGEQDALLLNRVLHQVKHSETFMRRVRELYENPDLDDHTEIELKNGTTLERHSTVLRDHELGYLGRVWFFSDFTSHKQAEHALKDLALTDSLTRIPNRRHFTMRAKEEFARSKRYQHPLSFVMFDIDHFKKINDEYGHGTGDKVLKVLCQQSLTILRETDFMARYGGEEFVILMPDTPVKDAAVSAERLREHIAEQAITTNTGTIRVTISLGVAQVGLADHSMADTLKRADDALYKAKDEGRNRTRTL